jgi:hypothetical protein
MRFWGEHNNTSYIITKFLSFYKGFVGNFGVRDENLQIFFTFSYDAHTALRARSRMILPILCLAAKNRRRKGIKGQAP